MTDINNSDNNSKKDDIKAIDENILDIQSPLPDNN